MRMMKPNKRIQIKFQEGVAIHHQEVLGAPKKSLSELESPAGPERMRLPRIFNICTQIASIPKLAFNLFREITGAHDQMFYPLANQLPNQEFEKRTIAHARQRFRRRGHRFTQASPQPPYEKNRLHVSILHSIGVTSPPGFAQ